MTPAMKKILALALVSTVAYGGWRWHHSSSSSDAGPRLAFDRLWIDHMPKNERDTIQIFVLFHEEAMGMFQATSRWKGSYEGFVFEANDGALRIFYPQNGDNDKVQIKATECNAGDMDYCLEVSGASRGVKKYYSREGWEIGNADALRHLADSLQP
jgi:hypothetical protein